MKNINAKQNKVADLYFEILAWMTSEDDAKITINNLEYTPTEIAIKDGYILISTKRGDYLTLTDKNGILINGWQAYVFGEYMYMLG